MINGVFEQKITSYDILYENLKTGCYVANTEFKLVKGVYNY